MSLYTLIGISIVVLAIAIKLGLRPSHIAQLDIPKIKCKWPWVLAVIVIFLIALSYWGYSSYKENAKADKKGLKNALVCKDEETSEWVKIPQGFYKEKESGECVEGTPPVPAVTATTEALVLESECYTPCSGNIPAGRFKIRTDGHPLRVKFKGLGWFALPAEGDVLFPDGIEDGNAEFFSSDSHVRVQVYKRITVPVQ